MDFWGLGFGGAGVMAWDKGKEARFWGSVAVGRGKGYEKLFSER